jgi:hypothetical protein
MITLLSTLYKMQLKCAAELWARVHIPKQEKRSVSTSVRKQSVKERCSGTLQPCYERDSQKQLWLMDRFSTTAIMADGQVLNNSYHG